MHEMLGWIGLDWPRTPLNFSLLLAVAAAVAVYLLLWRTQPGYALRAVGPCARRGGLCRHPAARARSCSRWRCRARWPALVGINEIAGVHNRLMPTSSPAPASPASRCR